MCISAIFRNYEFVINALYMYVIQFALIGKDYEHHQGHVVIMVCLKVYTLVHNHL